MTTSVISVRLPSDVLAEIDRMAESIGRSRNWYIHRCLVDRVDKGEDSSMVESLPSKQSVAGSSPAPRSIFHDSKTCRIYKCGMCAAEKDVG